MWTPWRQAPHWCGTYATGLTPKTVYGGSGAEEIALRLSEVHPSAPAALLKLWKRERLSTSIPRKLEKTEDLPQRLARFIAVVSEQTQHQG